MVKHTSSAEGGEKMNYISAAQILESIPEKLIADLFSKRSSLSIQLLSDFDVRSNM